MKTTSKLLAAGAVAALAAAGAAAYKKYMSSYSQVEEAEPAEEDSDFVPMQYIDDDDFEYVIEDEDQIMFEE